jgi:hypothetical protein
MYYALPIKYSLLDIIIYSTYVFLFQGSSVEDEDTEWEKFQTRLSKREKVLEGRSKQSHSVHCPSYPEVSNIFLSLYKARYIQIKTNK